jgi:predicted RND superfamily exporter protein
MLVYTMDYTSLEDAYGTAFGQRTPVTQERRGDPSEKALQTSKPIEQRGAESVEKHKSLIDSVKKTIGYDTAPETETFAVQQQAREQVRERFTGSQPANIVTDFNQTEKLSRILRLIEQNKTGYERPAIQDMVLYIATGIFFLFTFDTFVVLGKTMGRK